jgi:hypothetical protein
MGMPWDNHVFAGYQDVISGSAPTILQLTAVFAVAAPTTRVVTYCVYDATTLTALYMANLTLVAVCGPPGLRESTIESN